MTGRIGEAAMALKDLNAATPEWLTRYYRPEPRLAVGHALHGIATACIDISDGLIADLGHICAASHVGAAMEVTQIPFAESDDIERMLTGGDDYELLFTAKDAPREIEGVAITAIGEIIAQHGVVVKGYSGLREGYQHD